MICIDVAHGHDQRVYDLVQILLNEYDELTIIAGNIATASAAKFLLSACRTESDLARVVLKVGVGGGSVCATRV